MILNPPHPPFQETIRNELSLGDVDFNVKRDSNGRPGDVVKIVRSATLRSLKLNTGDVLYITPVEGTRCGFLDMHGSLQNFGTFQTSFLIPLSHFWISATCGENKSKLSCIPPGNY